MPAKHVTVEHEKIKAWSQERSGRPAAVTTGHPEDSLRLAFGERTREELVSISWEEFFRRFEEHHLAFVYQEEANDGGLSKSYRFVRRKSVGHEGPPLQKGQHPKESRGTVPPSIAGQLPDGKIKEGHRRGIGERRGGA